MELSRLVRVVRERWIFVVAMALMGLIAGFVLTTLNNSDIAHVFQAEAGLRIDPVEGQSLADQTAELETTQQLAIAAAADLLTAHPGSSIALDPEGNRVEFSALGSSQQEARERAEVLIGAYFDVDPVAGGSVDELLAELEAEAVALEQQFAEAQRTLSPEEVALSQRHDILDLEIAAISQLMVDLTVADAGASDDVREQNALRRDELQALLDERTAEKAALPPKPSTELSATESLQVNSIQRRLDLLALDYERLYLRKLGVTNTGRAEPIVIADLTPDPGSPFINGILGLIVGAGVGIMGLVVMTLSRKPVWLPEDVPVPVLGGVPGRKPADASGTPWYDSEAGGPRKSAIQALRSSIEGRIPPPPLSMGVAGLGTSSLAVHELAIDVAASFAAAGWSVLLVDADFGDDASAREYRAHGTDLSTVIGSNATQSSIDLAVRSALDNATYIREGLAVVKSGPSPSSPADALAGSQFRAFVSLARKRFDLVMVVGTDVTDPAAQVQMQRLGTMLLVVTPGHSTVPDVERIVVDLAERNVHTIGTVFLEKRGRISTVSHSGMRQGTPVSPSAGTLPSPINRLSAYPFPGSRASGVIRSDPLASLADRLEVDGAKNGAPEIRDLGKRIVAALDAAGPTAVDAVADYLVTRVEDIVTAVAGQGNVSEWALNVITRDGFVSMRPAPGMSTIGDLLSSELRDEIGSEAVTGKMLDVLTTDDESADLDSWLIQHFFRLHLERTKRSPQVWHLRSRHGTIELLVSARRLDSARLQRIEDELVSIVRDQLRRHLTEAYRTDRQDDVDKIEARLVDVNDFQASLDLLISGAAEGYDWSGTPGGYPIRWAPMSGEGLLANLAAFQRLGLLPVSVLSEEEMDLHLKAS